MRDTLDDKCEEYQSLADDEKAELRDWKVIEWFRQSNTRVVKSMRDHLHVFPLRDSQLICAPAVPIAVPVPPVSISSSSVLLSLIVPPIPI